jgi:hypothetical protein
MSIRDVPDLMTVPKVASYLRLSPRKICDLARTQRIPTCRIRWGRKASVAEAAH